MVRVNRKDSSEGRPTLFEKVLRNSMSSIRSLILAESASRRFWGGGGGSRGCWGCWSCPSSRPATFME